MKMQRAIGLNRLPAEALRRVIAQRNELTGRRHAGLFDKTSMGVSSEMGAVSQGATDHGQWSLHDYYEHSNGFDKRAA